MGSHALLQGIFLTWESNPCLLHCRRILYHWATVEAHGMKGQPLNACKAPFKKEERRAVVGKTKVTCPGKNLSWNWLESKEKDKIPGGPSIHQQKLCSKYTIIIQRSLQSEKHFRIFNPTIVIHKILQRRWLGVFIYFAFLRLQEDGWARVFRWAQRSERGQSLPNRSLECPPQKELKTHKPSPSDKYLCKWGL